MKKQLQGISFILFGILLMMITMIDPWVPIIEDVFTSITLWVGLISGIVGIIFSFMKED